MKERAILSIHFGMYTCSHTAGGILTTAVTNEKLNCRVRPYLHDIGNAINRVDHAHTGAILAYQILKDMGMDLGNSGLLLAITTRKRD